MEKFIVSTDRNGDEFFEVQDPTSTNLELIEKTFSTWCGLTLQEKKLQKVELRIYDKVSYKVLIEFSLEKYLDNLEVLLIDMLDIGMLEIKQDTFYSGSYINEHNLSIDQDDIESNKIYYKKGFYFEPVGKADLDFIENLGIFERCFYN